MIAGIFLCAMAWFYSVNVYETWFVAWGPTPHVERSAGGWTHDGPYKTKAACEASRARLPREPFRDYAHALRYDPQPCRWTPVPEGMGNVR